MGSVTGSAVRRGRGRAAAAVRQLLRARARATSAWSRCWPSVLLVRPQGLASVRRNGGDRDEPATVRAAACSGRARAAGRAGRAGRRCRTPQLDIPGLFDGPLNSPGTLQLLAICLVFGGLATGYDLLFGRTGMLSFGHALYFAAGVYGTDILVTRPAGRCGRRSCWPSPAAPSLAAGCSARWRCAPAGSRSPW